MITGRSQPYLKTAAAVRSDSEAVFTLINGILGGGVLGCAPPLVPLPHRSLAPNAEERYKRAPIQLLCVSKRHVGRMQSLSQVMEAQRTAAWHRLIDWPTSAASVASRQCRPLQLCAAVLLHHRPVGRRLILRCLVEPREHASCLRRAAGCTRVTQDPLGATSAAMSICGAGIRSLSRQCGVVMTSAMVLMCFCACQLSMQLLLAASQLSGRRSLEDLAHHCFGRVGRNAVQIAVFLLNMG